MGNRGFHLACLEEPSSSWSTLWNFKLNLLLHEPLWTAGCEKNKSIFIRVQVRLGDLSWWVVVLSQLEVMAGCPSGTVQAEGRHTSI